MAGVTTSTVLNTDGALKAREIDFVTRFDKNWDALRTILLPLSTPFNSQKVRDFPQSLSDVRLRL